MKNITRSLEDLLGKEYMQAVKSVAVAINGMDPARADFLASEKVDFFPDAYVEKMNDLAKNTGEKVVEGSYRRPWLHKSRSGRQSIFDCKE